MKSTVGTYGVRESNRAGTISTFNMWTTFRPDFGYQHFNMWTTFRREIANIQHPHLGRSKTTSCVILSYRCRPRAAACWKRLPAAHTTRHRPHRSSSLPSQRRPGYTQSPSTPALEPTDSKPATAVAAHNPAPVVSREWDSLVALPQSIVWRGPSEFRDPVDRAP